VQTWVIIVRGDQVQGALKSQLQRLGSCLHQRDKGVKVSLRKGWWQTGERTRIKAQQSLEIWVGKSVEPIFRLQILSPISVGRLIKLTPHHAYNDIWKRSQVETPVL